MHVAAFEDYMEISPLSRMQWCGQLSGSLCLSSASQPSLVAGLCPGVIQDAGYDL